jgi:Cdc6-like AAA superfamily ATPase
MALGSKIDLIERIAASFSPSAPIDSRVYSGRESQIADVINACLQRGQHVVIFGERGAGKTSLANTIGQMLRTRYTMPACGTINCDQTTTFASLWRSIFSEMALSRNAPISRNQGGTDRAQGTLAQLLPEEVTPHAVRTILQDRGKFLIIIDEVDRIKDRSTTTLLADTIKSLSDHAIDTTLVLVGVAESVDTLIAEHESVQRALIQVHMPRMSQAEIDRIIDNGLAAVGMSIEPGAKRRIYKLSQGLPHYAHLLGMHAALAAAAQDRTLINIEDTQRALRKALKQAQQSISDDYERAVTDAGETLYRWVLLACALASTDEHGYFTASDVVAPMSLLMKRDCQAILFARHLNAFCEDRHGPALLRTAIAHGYKYKFKNAAMQPYVIMKGLEAGIVPPELT